MTVSRRAFVAATFTASLLFGPLAMAQDTPVPLVRLITLGQDGAPAERTFFGRTVARQTVDLGFQVSGQLVEFPIAEGELIAAGTLIGRLDQKPFILALDEARLTEEQAQRDADRAEQLGGNVSRAQRETVQTQARLAGVARQNAELALERSTLLAPFDAVISTRTVANFTTVAAGQPVVRLHDMSELRIEIDVPETIVRQSGENPDFELLARFGGDDRLHPLKIVETDIETGPVAGTYRVTLGMEPPKDVLILPGYSVAVVMRRNGAKAPELTVPQDAIATTPEGGYFALRFTPEGEDGGKLTQVPVTIEASERGQIVVTSGLEAGDEIVSAGLTHLSDGQAVKRFRGIGQ
ncbi:efflux RND transporter periplasmic adaptor subunit [Paracoccus sp. (in: a-proteobacteria)]|uniref:efflux RND transporter periplasmic adaptor subunit n=1 Tax=Paracoccus sp. TaxID=267 RepID=UPI0035B28E06